MGKCSTSAVTMTRASAVSPASSHTTGATWPEVLGLQYVQQVIQSDQSNHEPQAAWGGQVAWPDSEQKPEALWWD